VNYGHWEYHTTIDVDNSFGFVYLITNMITGRKYLGKKQFHSYRKKKRVAETKWQNYTGSSVELNQDIKNMRKSNFHFLILQVYKTRGGLVYGEANMQHKLDTLTDTDKDGDRNWYNKQIGSIKFIPKEYYP
jgi:hypothetical protein